MTVTVFFIPCPWLHMGIIHILESTDKQPVKQFFYDWNMCQTKVALFQGRNMTKYSYWGTMLKLTGWATSCEIDVASIIPLDNLFQLLHEFLNQMPERTENNVKSSNENNASSAEDINDN